MQQSRIQSWPRLISTYKDLPSHFAEHFQIEERHDYKFPYTIYLPSYSWNERETNELLLSISDRGLSIYEETKSGVNLITYSFEDIILMNRGTMLLYSWIKVVGHIDGRVKTTFIEFNTVTEGMFDKLLAMIRMSYMSQPCACSSGSLLDDLEKTDYKFMNYTKKGMLPGQVISDLLFQPVIKERYMKFFSRIISKPHLHIATDSELIVIKEDNPDVKRFKTKKYLAVWHYIPKYRIRSIAVENCNNDATIEMKIELTDGICMSSIFDISNKKSLTEFIRHIGC